MTRKEFLNVALIQATEEGVGIHLAKFADICIKWGQQHPRWISVKDELPMELEPVLAAFGNHYARVCFYNGGKWYIDAGVMSDEAFGVSHWMPLPQAPSSSEIPNNCEKGGEDEI